MEARFFYITDMWGGEEISKKSISPANISWNGKSQGGDVLIFSFL